MTIEQTKATEQGEAPADAQALSSEAVARRHLLLKGLGRGSAVLAASIPLKTLASTSVFTNRGANGAAVIQCSVSGMNSVAPSQSTTSQVCSGYNPTRYQNGDSWPSGVKKNLRVTSIFPSCKLLTNKGLAPTLLQVMKMGPSVPDFHWVGAYLNAQPGAVPIGWNFPYNGAQIQAFYAATPNTRALAFFTTYMETI